jgi:hypothetical protein
VRVASYVDGGDTALLRRKQISVVCQQPHIGPALVKLEPAALDRSLRQLREEFSTRLARSASLLLKALQASVNRLARTAQLLSYFISCCPLAKEREQSNLFLRKPRSSESAAVRHKGGLRAQGRGGAGRLALSGIRGGVSTRAGAAKRLGSGTRLPRVIHAASCA